MKLSDRLLGSWRRPWTGKWNCHRVSLLSVIVQCPASTARILVAKKETENLLMVNQSERRQQLCPLVSLCESRMNSFWDGIIKVIIFIINSHYIYSSLCLHNTIRCFPAFLHFRGVNRTRIMASWQAIKPPGQQGRIFRPSPFAIRFSLMRRPRGIILFTS